MKPKIWDLDNTLISAKIKTDHAWNTMSLSAQ